MNNKSGTTAVYMVDSVKPEELCQNLICIAPYIRRMFIWYLRLPQGSPTGTMFHSNDAASFLAMIMLHCMLCVGGVASGRGIQ